jgi:hypothetical protein
MYWWQGWSTWFVVALPADTFAHSDSQAQIAVTAASADGTKLPDWLNFSVQDKKFTVVPPPGVSSLEVVVTSRDSAGNRAATRVTITFD